MTPSDSLPDSPNEPAGQRPAQAASPAEPSSDAELQPERSQESALPHAGATETHLAETAVEAPEVKSPVLQPVEGAAPPPYELPFASDVSGTPPGPAQSPAPAPPTWPPPLQNPSLSGTVPAFPPPGLTPSARRLRVLLSIIVPNVLALGLLGLTSLIMSAVSTHEGYDNRTGTYIFAEFVLIPFAMGVGAAFCLRDTGTGIGTNLLISLANTAIAIGLSALVIHEGYICLIMVSPLILCFIAVGGLLGRLLFKSRARKLQMSIAPAILILLVGDACSPHGFQNSITDVITINAPPERVWQYVIDYPAITEKPDYWLWRIGLPAPVQSTATGHVVGSARRCVFQGNIAYDERLVEVEPNRKVAFDIVGQPHDPEIMDHLDLKRGQMVLRDNHDGTTTLIGTSWYSLRVYPSAYYDLWTQDIMRHVHLRVMRRIKQLAEAPGGG